MDLKGELLGLKSKLETIEKDFTEKLIDVTDKEEVNKRLDQKLECLVEDKKTPLVNLNIGGKIFSTRLSTLLSCKECIFYKDLSKYVDEGKKVPDVLFYDRAYTHFGLILDYLRYQRFSIKKYKGVEREEIREEVAFYGLEDVLQISKKEEYEIDWDRTLSKQGQCTITEDTKVIRIHSNNCYTHFVTNKLWNNQDFQIELEVAVTQTDSYLFVGLINSTYSRDGNCGCCNPPNAFYVQCDGSIHINSVTSNNPQVRWNSQRIIIGMKVYLSETQKRMYFYFPEKGDLEIGPYNLTGTGFRVYVGHCNTGNGEIRILDCFAIKD